MADAFEIEFGLPEEWRAFAESHRLFLERFPNLKEALNVAFIRKGSTSEPVDRVVFFQGRLCCEDFFEILLLCGNGYGIGALKILRGMYERAVTARYLHLHPEETEAFFDFHPVSQYKLARAIKDSIGVDAVPPEKMLEVECDFRRVRNRFMVTNCEKCKTQRLHHTWTKLDFVSMAGKVGSLGRLIVPGYYLPTRQAHSTVAALLSRSREAEGGGITFDEGPQRSEAEDALITAHNLLLNILDLQKEHFKLDVLEQPLQRCIADFFEIWRKPKEGTHD